MVLPIFLADTNKILDGNTQLIGVLVDSILKLFEEIFRGLAGFGNTMGILIGVGFVLTLILIAVGKIKINGILGGFR